ncbi:MAG: rhodanese-like domain-containing protein [Desulfovibrio sp.]|nr:rhodanese-like domain-containing protein [Desulfovibrio sp.]
MSSAQSISARELHAVDLRQALIIDVRSPMEYSEKRLATPTAFAPVTDLDPHDAALRSGALEDTPILVLCRSGARAKVAAEKFMQSGFSNVRFIEGGLDACQQEGFATVGEGASKTGPPSLDRQVRLVAGAMILTFSLLGFFVHQAFFLGALFVGAGLVFAGITNTCGMALLLMRAPWNQKGASCALGKSCSIGAAKAGNNATSKDTGKSPGTSCQ